MKNKYLAYFKLFLIHPKLLFLARHIRTSQRTFLSYGKILSLVENFQKLRKNSSREFHIAEFGVGRGGSAMVFAWLIQQHGGTLHLFDVFGRIPSPSANDGEAAQKRYAEILHNEKETYYGNLPDLISIIKKEIAEVTSLENVEFIAGKYEDVLPALQNQPAYDLVHIDCDWYESTKSVLHFLEIHTKPNSIIQIDDYLHWKGSHLAVQEAGWLDLSTSRIIDDALVIDMGKK